MIPKYVGYYKECYNYERKLWREFFKIESHPLQTKIITSSKSKKITIQQKLQEVQEHLNKLNQQLLFQENTDVSMDIILPTPSSGSGKLFNIKKIDNTGNMVNVYSTDGSYIDFSLTQSLTSRGTATSRDTSTVFNTTRTTVFATGRTTTTTIETSRLSDTTRTTTPTTTTTFDTSTVVFERITASAAGTIFDTEVSSADAFSASYWDGNQWTE